MKRGCIGIIVGLLLMTGCSKTDRLVKEIRAIQKEISAITQTGEVQLLGETYTLTETGTLPADGVRELTTLDLSVVRSQAASFSDVTSRPLLFRTGWKRSGVEYHLLLVDEKKGEVSVQKGILRLPRGGEHAVLSDHSPLTVYRGSSLMVLDPYRKKFFEWGLNGKFLREISLNDDMESLWRLHNITGTSSSSGRVLSLAPRGIFLSIWNDLQKSPMDRPQVTHVDLSSGKKETVFIKGLENEKNWHALALADNGPRGLVYIPAAEPSLLFIDSKMSLAGCLDLAPLLKEEGLEELYESSQYMLEWGDITRISPNKLLILFPLVFSQEWVTPYTKEGKVDLEKMKETTIQLFGKREQWSSRYAVLVDTQKQEVIRQGIFDKAFPTDKLLWILTHGFTEATLIVGPEARYLLYLFKNKVPDEKELKRGYTSRESGPFTYALFTKKDV